MAIIYTYPQINSSSDLEASDLMIISDMSANGKPTKALTLKNLADFVTSTGTGTGTTNAIIKWTDGPAGLLGDSIMTENATQIDLAGTFLSTSSPTGTSGPIHGIRANQTSTATGAFNIALYGDSKHTGANKGSYNYGLYTKAEFEGTNGYDGVLYGAYTEARYDGSGTNATWSSLYGAQAKARVTATATGDLGYMIGNNISSVMDTGTAVDVEFLQGQHTNVTFNSGNVSGDIAVNLLDFDYPGGGTLQGDFAYLQIQNDPVPTPVTGTARAINSDSTLPSHFSGDVEIPLIPTANAHATSKQYVDQQISSIPAGLVFKGNWNASTNTPTLASGTGTVGNYHVVSVAGNTNLDGITDWEVGDWAVFVEVGGVDKWDKIDQTFVQGAGATGQVSFWNGVNSVTGDNDFYWNNTNMRLGIKTTSPEARIHVRSNDNQVGRMLLIDQDGTGDATLAFRLSGTIEYAIGIDNSDNDSFKISNGNSVGSTDYLTINSSGNVGIGTTSPVEKLHVVDGSDSFKFSADIGSGFDGIKLEGGAPGVNFAGPGDDFVVGKITAGLSFFNNTVQSYKMVLTDAGNLGIGHSFLNPTVKLQVKSGNENLVAQFESDDSIAEIRIKDNTAYSRLLNVGAQLKLMPNDGVEMLVIDGNTNTVNVPDDKSLTFGANNDLLIQHNSGASLNQIDNINGDLYIQQNANDKDIIFRCDNGSGGVTSYYTIDGSAELNRFQKNVMWNDTVVAYFGGGFDLQISHNATDSIIQNNTGDLYIANSADDRDIIFQSDDGSGGMTTYLMLDGSQKYVNVKDNITFTIGSGNDLRISHDGSDSKIENYTGNLTIQQRADDSNIAFQCDDGSGGLTEYFRVDGGDEVTLFSKNVKLSDNVQLLIGDGADFRISHDGTSSSILSNNGNIVITNNDDDSDIIFKCDNGSGGVSQYFRLDGSAASAGTVYTVFPDNSRATFGTGFDLQIYHDSTDSYISDTGTGDLIIQGSNDVWIKEGTDNLARFNGQGVKLYYLNVSKLETISSGAKLPGPGDGITLVSPDGNTTRKISIDNSGNLVVA